MALGNNPTQLEVVKAIKDLENKPSGSATDVQVNGTSITSDSVANIVTQSAYNASTNKIATMNDVPTVNNGTLTIQKNGTQVATFTANQSGNSTANITVPTKTSELANDSGFTSNTGTVTSVGAGTGLSISGTASTNPTVNIASGYKLPTTTEWNAKADASAIPTNFVTTDTAQTISGAKTLSTDLTFNASRQTQLIYKTNGTITSLIRSGILNGSEKYIVTQADKHYWGSIANANRVIFDAANKGIYPENNANITLGGANKHWSRIIAEIANAYYYSNIAISRPTSADFAHYYDEDYVTKGRIHTRIDVASGNMTTSKPASNGYIQTYFWDNSGMYDAQLFVPNSKSGNNGHPQIRWNAGANTGTANWNNWANIALEKDVSHFATCTTAAGTKDKVATISGVEDYVLRVGAIVGVKFTNTNTYSATTSAPVTLNINNTGAKNIYFNNTATPTGTNTTAFGAANRIMYYMYDGTYWVFLGWSGDNNSTGYLSYTATSVGDTDTNTQYLIGKRVAASNGTNYYNSSIYFKGYNLYTYNCFATSDRRLKENIKDAELDCGAVIDELPIREFNFKSDEEKKVVVGAIAQELQEILPEKYRATLVSGSENTSYSINEGKLLYVAIGALKEERAKTKELEERLARLEAKLGV